MLLILIGLMGSMSIAGSIYNARFPAKDDPEAQ